MGWEVGGGADFGMNRGMGMGIGRGRVVLEER